MRGYIKCLFWIQLNTYVATIDIKKFSCNQMLVSAWRALKLLIIPTSPLTTKLLVSKVPFKDSSSHLNR